MAATKIESINLAAELKAFQANFTKDVPEEIVDLFMKKTEELLQRIAFPAGRVGSTAFATRFFHEFVGTPTSGLSMRRRVAEQLLKLRDDAGRLNQPPRIVRLLFGPPFMWGKHGHFLFRYLHQGMLLPGFDIHQGDLHGGAA